jgi:hypothetical protein
MRVAVRACMKLTRRQEWLLFATAVAAVAGPLAGKAASAAWRGTTGEEPPDDAADTDPDWTKVLLWTVGSAVVTSVVKVAARQAAAVAWEGLRGEKPPPRKRGRRRRRRRAYA